MAQGGEAPSRRARETRRRVVRVSQRIPKRAAVAGVAGRRT